MQQPPPEMLSSVVEILFPAGMYAVTPFLSFSVFTDAMRQGSFTDLRLNERCVFLIKSVEWEIIISSPSSFFSYLIIRVMNAYGIPVGEWNVKAAFSRGSGRSFELRNSCGKETAM